jgi:WD40 repeat protein/predicted Ser/Thr protein kinase
MMRAALDASDPIAAAEPEPSGTPSTQGVCLGDFEVLEEIGRGGMGIVYRARQKSVGRMVAVKILHPGRMLSAGEVERFRQEAEIVARLEHPNIVPVYDAGEDAGQPWCAMKLVQGGTLAKRTSQIPALTGNKVPFAAIADSMSKIATAVHHAHQRGVLHRDLKPSNILLDEAGQPYVTDFGVARVLDQDSALTRTGAFLGSPAYSAPEQAASDGRKVTTAADIYGLGAILYELLTGRPPFTSATPVETLRQVLESEPTKPHLIRNDVPLDLETICLKCLEKEPSRRYSSAQGLADDLGRFLSEEPVQARPVSPVERSWRWCRRKPVLASLIVTVLALVLAVLIGAPVAVVRINRALARAERNLYAADMRQASEALRNGDLGGVRELLDRHRPRPGTENLCGFEWRYLANVANQSSLLRRPLHGLMTGEHLDSEHSEIAMAEGILYNFRPQPSDVLFWDSKTWEGLPLKLPTPRPSEWWWHPEEQILLALDNRRSAIAIYRLPNFEQTLVVPVPGPVSYSAISRDSRTLAIAFQEGSVHRILVWDLTTNSRRWALGKYNREVSSLRFSADGTVLAAISADGQIGLWSVQQGTALPSPVQDASLPEVTWKSAQFVGSNSTQLLLFDRNPRREALEVWDWKKAEVMGVHQTPLYEIQSFGLSPNGSLLAIGQWDGTIALLEIPSLRLVGKLVGNGAPVICLVFSPSGRFIATGCNDRSLKLWDAEAQRPLETIGGNDDPVRKILFTPDESSVLGLLEDGTIKVWNLKRVLERNVLWRRIGGTPSERAGDGLESFAVSPDERTIALADRSGCIHFRDRTSWAELRKIQSGESALTAFSVSGLTFSSKGNVAAWSGANWFGIVDYDSGFTNTFPISGRFGYCNTVFLPNERAVAFATATNLMIWDVAKRSARRFVAIQNSVLCLAVSPDASLIAGAQDGGAITLWELPSGGQIATITNAHRLLAFEVEFSPDGRLLASAGADSTAKIWEVHNGELKLLHTLRGLVGWVEEATFSPDGSRLVCRSNEDALRIWDIKTGLEVGTIYDQGNRFASGTCFSKDGNTLYSANKQGDVRAWQAPPAANP